MTEEELLERWRAERPMYEAWGTFVADALTAEIQSRVAPVSTDIFIRIPVAPRAKGEGSFVVKAFYRPEKKYDDPYEEITDKVGVRFVVLLARDVTLIGEALEACKEWEWSKDKDYETERAASPYAFPYQSVHYVVRCSQDRTEGGVRIAEGTPCEVQIRTLLQHAHSELTHDTIYKPSVVQTPEMMRAAGKSMALVEATGDYFDELVEQIEAAVGPNRKLTEQLTAIYVAQVKRPVDLTRAEGLLSDVFMPMAGDDAAAQVTKFLSEKPFIADRIRDRADTKLLFRQPSILLVYMLAAREPYVTADKWPLTESELRPIFTDLGKSLPAS